jgi:long-chain acyl-CoA synthetase
MTVPELFKSAVNKFSQSDAVVEDGKRVSYSELGRFVNRFSTYLTSLGIKKGDRVLILLPNSIEFVTAFFGVAQLGAVSVPVSTAFKKQEIQFYIEHSGASLILTDGGFAGLLKESASKSGALITNVKGSSADWHMSDEAQLDIGVVHSEDEAIYLYSTGSTGKPKRVARTHKNLIALADNHTQTVGWDKSDRVLFTVPISHTYGFGNFISSIKIGAAVVTLGEFNRHKVLERIEKESVTVFPTVPVMLDALSRTHLREPGDLSSLKLVISAGAPLSEKIFRSFHSKFGIYPRQLYGSTETGVISINLGDSVETRFSSVGRAVQNVEVRILDDRGEDVISGQVGEIAVKSPSMTTGYYGLPEESAKVFKNGYYFTGDLGRIDPDGYIYIVGRKKLFINISGNKVDPAEVENVLSTHPLVIEAAVLGVYDDKGGEVVKAVLVAEGGVEPGKVLEYCRDRLAGYKVPRIIEFTDELPRSPSGKVLREQLK